MQKFVNLPKQPTKHTFNTEVMKKNDKKLVLIGKISGAFSTQGQVKIACLCESIQTFRILNQVIIEGYSTAIKLNILSTFKKTLIVRLPYVQTREQARELTGNSIFCFREDLPTTKENEYYYSDLEKCKVLDTEGNVVGQVTAVLNYGAGDILEIKKVEGLQKTLLPFTKDLVPEVDINSKTITLKKYALADTV